MSNRMYILQLCTGMLHPSIDVTEDITKADLLFEQQIKLAESFIFMIRRSPLISTISPYLLDMMIYGYQSTPSIMDRVDALTIQKYT
jgi:hypothetical protein